MSKYHELERRVIDSNGQTVVLYLLDEIGDDREGDMTLHVRKLVTDHAGNEHLGDKELGTEALNKDLWTQNGREHGKVPAESPDP